MTHAASSPTAARSASSGVAPVASSTSTTTIFGAPSSEARRYVASVSRYSGCTPDDTTIFSRPLTRRAMSAASVIAVAPSYIEALDTSMPRIRHTIVWNSKIAWSVPWLTSGWYGVYAV